MNHVKNFVQLIGHLGQDPELKITGNENSLLKCSIATNHSYTNKLGEKVVNTQWHNIVAWGKPAELMSEILKKGSYVLIQGKLEHSSYEDKEGQTRYISQVIASEFLLLDKIASPSAELANA